MNSIFEYKTSIYLITVETLDVQVVINANTFLKWDQIHSMGDSKIVILGSNLNILSFSFYYNSFVRVVIFQVNYEIE